MIPTDIYQANGFALSPMTEHDLLEVVEIEEMCRLSRWGWEGYHTELLSEQFSLMLVAHALTPSNNSGEDERIAGFIAARLAAHEVHINNVAVRPIYRRSGIGGALLSAVLERGKERGAQRGFLEVRASNMAAQRLYARHGFAVVGRRAKYYSQPVEDALVMAVSL